MDLAHVRAQLEIDEGKRLTVYKDSLGYLTVGIGHLVARSDGLALGDSITEGQCQDLFNQDVARHLAECQKRIPGWVALHPTVQEVLLNMAFNLGITKLLGFNHTLEFLAQRRYHAAASAMLQSLWARQVGARARRLAKRIFDLAESTT